jgi:hypothetical protein
MLLEFRSLPNSGGNNVVVENGIISLESYVYSCREVKSAVAMQSILYMDFGRKPLKKCPTSIYSVRLVAFKGKKLS